MNRHTGLLPTLAVAVGAIILGAASPSSFAEEPFPVANLFFELNDTDGDLGIHALIDGDAWKKLEIEDTKEREILDITVKGRLRRQGLTEIFFESAEPPFESDDPEELTLTPEQFFRRFPEGTYEIEGKTIEGGELESEVQLTHVMPAPPEPEVNGQTAAEDCDAVLPVVSPPVTISWDPVTMSHPDLGTSGVPIQVINYEVVVEIDETPYKSSTILPPSATSFQVPSEILALGDEIKFEVLVREESYNQTAAESCFELL